MKKSLYSALLGASVLAGCASGGTMSARDAWTACSSDRSSSHHVEVYIARATVTRVLGMRESRSGAHEGFLIEASGDVYKVEDNADITGPIPLQRGDTLSLLGQFECNDNVIHWTHHDPRGRHAAGYIEVNGKRYQ